MAHNGLRRQLVELLAEGIATPEQMNTAYTLLEKSLVALGGPVVDTRAQGDTSTVGQDTLSPVVDSGYMAPDHGHFGYIGNADPGDEDHYDDHALAIAEDEETLHKAIDAQFGVDLNIDGHGRP